MVIVVMVLVEVVAYVFNFNQSKTIEDFIYAR